MRTFVDLAGKTPKITPNSQGFIMFLTDFLIGYYSYQEEKEYISLVNEEQRAGYLSAGYEVTTGTYIEHYVFDNLGICVMPRLL